MNLIKEKSICKSLKNISTTSFTSKDDKKLIELVETYGSRFAIIRKKYFKDRSTCELRQRYEKLISSDHEEEEQQDQDPLSILTVNLIESDVFPEAKLLMMNLIQQINQEFKEMKEAFK